MALSGLVEIIQPTDNDIIFGRRFIPTLRSEREKICKALDLVLHLGKPTNVERFRKELERGDIKRQFGIAERMLEDIQNNSDPPVR